MEIEPHRWYRATVRYRRPPAFPLPVKPEAEPLDGWRGVFLCLWQCAPEETYAGEYALQPHRGPRVGIGWVASGDLVDVEECEAPTGPLV
jgi:hypothetical protein